MNYERKTNGGPISYIQFGSRLPFLFMTSSNWIVILVNLIKM